MAARRRKGKKAAHRPARRAARPKRKRAAPPQRKPARKQRLARKRKPAARPRKRSASSARPRKRPAGSAKPTAASSRPVAAALRERLAAGVPIEVGVVLHWFPHVSAAVVALSHPIHVGDTIHVRGRSTDFVQQVGSLALDGAPVRDGTPPQELGVRLATRARPGDRVYRVSW
jgi:putative protease